MQSATILKKYKDHYGGKKLCLGKRFSLCIECQLEILSYRMVVLCKLGQRYCAKLSRCWMKSCQDTIQWILTKNVKLLSSHL